MAQPSSVKAYRMMVPCFGRGAPNNTSLLRQRPTEHTPPTSAEAYRTQLWGVNKGLVAKRLLSSMQEREMSPDFVPCIGDDRSDEDMFEVITSSISGPSIAPRAEVFACTVCRKPSKAKYYLDDAAEIVRLMKGLACVTEQTVPL